MFSNSRQCRWQRILSIQISVFFLLSTGFLIAEAKEPPQYLHFKTLGKAQGLSQSRAMCASYDSHRGLIWIGTGGGINSYDGHRVYPSPHLLKGRFTDVFVEGCKSDKSGNVYFAMYDQGLLHLRGDNKLVHYHNNTNPQWPAGANVHDVTIDKEQQLWLASNKGLIHITPSQQQVQQYLPHLDVVNLVSFQEHIYLSSKTGLFRYTPKTQELKNLSNNTPGISQQFYDLDISEQGLYASNAKDGTFFYNPRSQRLEKLESSQRQFGLGISLVDDYLFYSANTIGLTVVNTKDGSHQVFNDKNSQLLGTNFYDIRYEPEINSILLAGRGGLVIVNQDQLHIKTYTSDSNIIPHNKIWFFAEHEDTVWIASSGGVARHSKSKKTSKFYSLNHKNSIANDVWAIYVDKNKDVWIGTSLGIAKYHSDTDSFKALALKPGFSPDVISITGFKDQGLWIGTFGQGLYRYYFDGRVESFPALQDKQHIQSSGILSLLEVDNSLWIGGSVNGAARYDYDSQTFHHYPSSNNKGPFDSAYVRQIIRSKSGKLWFANDRGLYFLNSDNNIVKDKFIDHELIYCLAEGPDNKLYIGTNNGLIVYTPGKSKYTLLESDGLQSNEYNGRACYTMNDGRLAVGGISGFSLLSVGTADKIQSRGLPQIRISSFNSDQSSDYREANRFFISRNTSHLDISLSSQNFYSEFNTQYFYRINQSQLHPINKYPLGLSLDLPPNGLTHVSIFRQARGQNQALQALELIVDKQLYWWQTLVGKTLIAVLCLTTLYVLYRLRIRWLRQYNQRLQNKVKNKTQFLQQAVDDKNFLLENISHEIKTPLTLILGRVQRLTETTHNPGTKEELELIEDSALRLHSLTDQLTQLGDVKHGLRHQVSIDLLATTRFSLASLNTLIEDYHSSLDYQSIGFGSRYFVQFQKDGWQTIIANLVSNAAKYGVENDRIEVLLSQDNGSLQLSVSNTPAQAIPDNTERLFIRGHRGNHQQPGQGLGLSIVKELVENHGGDIDFQQQGERLICIIKLRLSQAQSLNDDPVPHRRTGSTEAKETIMLVEDHEELRQFTEDILAQHYHLISCANGQQALTALSGSESELPQLIISDIAMPIMDGFALAEALKRNELYRHIPLFLLTAKSERESKSQALKLGVDDFINKPFDPSMLLQIIANRLELQKALQATIEKRLTHSEPGQDAESELLDPLLQQVRQAIAQHFHKPDCKGQDIAKHLNIGEKTLNRRLRLQANSSVAELIRAYRLEQAQAILSKGHSVKEACFSCGFSSSSYFSQSFKQRFGLSPSQFRER